MPRRKKVAAKPFPVGRVRTTIRRPVKLVSDFSYQKPESPPRRAPAKKPYPKRRVSNVTLSAPRKRKELPRRVASTRSSAVAQERPESLSHWFDPPLELPLSPARDDTLSQERRRIARRPVEFDERFKIRGYSTALRKLLVKLGDLTKRGKIWRIPLSESNEIVDYSVRHTFYAAGIGQDGEYTDGRFKATVRIISSELEAIVSVSQDLDRILWRAYRHVWFGEIWTFFQSGGLEEVELEEIEAERISLTVMRLRERAAKGQHLRNYKAQLKKNPRKLFGVLRAGKKFYPRGRRQASGKTSEVWEIESAKVRKKTRLIVVKKLYDKKGKLRKREVLWKPGKKKNS